MATPASVGIDRPLRVGELLATAVRIFNGRAWAFLGLGLVQAVALVAAAVAPVAAGLAILAAAFAASFAATVRLVAGDPLGEALRRTAVAAPVLAVLAFVVAVPFYLGSAWMLLLVFSVGWIGLTAFAIPAAMVEEPKEPGWLGGVTHALRRTLALARIEYLHAVGVAATLVIVYIVVGILLAVVLVDFADNGRIAAQAIAQIVLAPFFFIGLSVLYFEQGARALEAAGRPGKRR